MKTLCALLLLPSLASAYCDQYGACSTGGPALVAPDGRYLGRLSANPYALDSTSNPYGQYGSPYSLNSINNPYSTYGSPYSLNSPNNPYAVGRGVSVYGD